MKRAITAVVCVYFGIMAVVYATSPLAPRHLVVFGDTVAVIAALFASVAIILTAGKYGPRDPHRRVWQLIGWGLFLWFLGELAWWIIEVALRREVPFPSVADAFWLAGYPPIFLGLLAGFRALDVRLKRVPFFLLLCLLGMLLTTYLLVMLLPLIRSDIGLTEKMLDLAYPLGDLLILSPAVLTFFTLRYGVLGRPWFALVSGFALMAGADTIFSYLTFNDLYKTGSAVDLFWVAGYLIIGMASVQQAEMLNG